MGLSAEDTVDFFTSAKAISHYLLTYLTPKLPALLNNISTIHLLKWLVKRIERTLFAVHCSFA